MGLWELREGGNREGQGGGGLGSGRTFQLGSAIYVEPDLYLQDLNLQIQMTMAQKYSEKNDIFFKYMQRFSLSLFPEQHSITTILCSLCNALGIRRNLEMS